MNAPGKGKKTKKEKLLSHSPGNKFQTFLIKK